MNKLVTLLVVMLLGIVALSSYVVYQNMPGQPQSMAVELRNPDIVKNLTAEVKQFEKNMRFNHNDLTFSFTEDCDDGRVNQMLKAFSIISHDTPITFSEESNDADITISCSQAAIEKEKNVFVAGEGGPKEFVNSTIYPIILKGSILLYQKSDCKEPIVELHELLHVFGFDHINDSSSIMYPYADCSQKLKPEYAEYITALYSITPKAELLFSSANLTKSGRYLNFQVLVLNRGMLNASESYLSVSAEGKELERFDLREMPFGAGKKFFAENIRLPSRSVSQATLEIIYSGEEYDKSNNIITAYLQE